jgi:hypothetical protein
LLLKMLHRMQQQHQHQQLHLHNQNKNLISLQVLQQVKMLSFMIIHHSEMDLLKSYLMSRLIAMLKFYKVK